MSFSTACKANSGYVKQSTAFYLGRRWQVKDFYALGLRYVDLHVFGNMPAFESKTVFKSPLAKPEPMYRRYKCKQCEVLWSQWDNEPITCFACGEVGTARKDS